MAGSSWPDLVAGRTAKASEVEAKFDWIEGHIYPMNSGTSTDLAYDLGSVSARWRSTYTGSINPTSTAGGLAIGTSTCNASAILEMAGTKAMLLPRLTTTERDALTAVNGMMIYNSTLNQTQKYENGAWKSTGGTVFRTQPAAETSTTLATTQTALSVASGGGRINGITFKTAVADATVIVVCDGVTVAVASSATDAAQTLALTPAGTFAKISSAETFEGVTGAVPFLGFDFATSCAIYFYSATPGSITCRYVHSLIV